jgi:hypothetical protein
MASTASEWFRYFSSASLDRSASQARARISSGPAWAGCLTWGVAGKTQSTNAAKTARVDINPGDLIILSRD